MLSVGGAVVATVVLRIFVPSCHDTPFAKAHAQLVARTPPTQVSSLLCGRSKK